MLALDFVPHSPYNSGIATASSFPTRRSPLGLRDSSSAGNQRSPILGSNVSSQKFFSRMSSNEQENLDRSQQACQERQPQRRLAAEQPRKREGKFASLLRKKDDRDLRRSAYLSNARRAGDDKLFEARAEQTYRRDWLDRQREWEAQMEAQHASEQPLEDVEFLLAEEQQGMNDDTMQEDDTTLETPSDEEDAYYEHFISQQFNDHGDIELPELSQCVSSTQAPERSSAEFWSDDDDMEQLLLEAATQVERQGHISVEQMDTDMSM